jgi:hypothetical protein
MTPSVMAKLASLPKVPTYSADMILNIEQKQMAVDKLDEWRLAGLDYATALESAAIGGNQGLFLPTTPRAGQPNKQQAIEDRNLAVARQWVEDSHAIQ